MNHGRGGAPPTDSWKKQTPAVRGLDADGDEFTAIQDKFLDHDIWKRLKPGVCRAPKAAAKGLNKLARANRPKAAPRSMTA